MKTEKELQEIMKESEAESRGQAAGNSTAETQCRSTAEANKLSDKELEQVSGGLLIPAK